MLSHTELPLFSFPNRSSHLQFSHSRKAFYTKQTSDTPLFCVRMKLFCLFEKFMREIVEFPKRSFLFIDIELILSADIFSGLYLIRCPENLCKLSFFVFLPWKRVRQLILGIKLLFIFLGWNVNTVWKVYVDFRHKGTIKCSGRKTRRYNK